jgi:hypothetical protein
MQVRIMSVAFAIGIAVTNWVCAGDVLSTGSAKYEGIFEGFAGNSFSFRAAKRANTLKQHVGSVKSLTMASPAKVTYILNGGKKPEDAVLTGYEKSNFVFEKDGQELRIPAVKIREIKMPFFDPDRIDAQAVETTRIISTGGEVDIAPLIKKDTVTILHVHSDEVAQSVKLCNFIDKLGSDSHGKVCVLRASIPLGDCDFTRQYKITSIPQFWFYNGRGELVKTITEMFNPGQFDAALKQARK